VSAVCPDDALHDLLGVTRALADDDLPFYTVCLTRAFDDVQPVFAQARYAEFFWHCATRVPGYIERVMLANGPAEAEGSEKLFELWQGVDYDTQAEAQVLRHAYDEARHARIFLRLTRKAFPSFLGVDDAAQVEARLPDVRKLPRAKSPERIPHTHLIDNLVQMNIGEIRTRLHMHLFAPIVLHFTPPSNQSVVRGIFTSLVTDEVRHIAYTAQLMEAWARDGDAAFIGRLYQGRLRTFNRLTVEHTRGAIEKFGEGAFPDLLEVG
ncbi:MAG TPA: hypothetical protein VFH51_18880, partial [Myxococcota bacterium]|nr:hypothetical protein [Myxococcota bacterium]